MAYFTMPKAFFIIHSFKNNPSGKLLMPSQGQEGHFLKRVLELHLQDAHDLHKAIFNW